MRIEVLGVDCNYRQYGKEGPEVLLLHGWGCSLQYFQPIADALSARYHVTAIDFPAHGESSRPPEPWGVPEFAAWTKELILKLNIAPCDIVAHSFGGRIALWLAAYEPALVKRLVLTGCAGLKGAQTKAQKKRSELYKRQKALLDKIRPLPLFGPLADRAAETLRKKYGSADYNALDAEMRKSFVKIVSQDLCPLLPMVRASTLLLWGENDTETPLWIGKEMENRISDAGLVVFECGDHFAFIKEWKRFVTILETFLK